MSFFHYVLLFASLLLLLTSWTTAITLDIPCTNATQCGGLGTACPDGKCRCDTPWYTPCRTTECSVNNAFVYEGKECRTNANCLSNALCESHICRCTTGFTPINGLCYKSLNTSCSSLSECWSNECRDGVCKCSLGYRPRSDNSRCEQRLAKLHVNWTTANADGDFCYPGLNANGCLDPYATCRTDSMNREAFCQCLPPYVADYNQQECRLSTYNSGELSPSMTMLPYEECGTCNDENALCVRVDNQTTCWCQSGFIKTVNNKCESSRQYFLFPDAGDINQHQYASPNCAVNETNGTSLTNNRLCACAPGYVFVDKTSSCRLIKPQWVNEVFEYGVCTRINSDGYAVAENGLCPLPLTCQPRQDKHVCACDRRDMYLEESNNTCYYFLNRMLASPDASRCPPSATVNNTMCQCSPADLYIPSSDNKRCELNLIDRQTDTSCTSNNDPGYDQHCSKLYGEHTLFCKRGECRCISGNSYYHNGTCVTLLYVDPGRTPFCPPNAGNYGSQCQCKTGYRAVGIQNRTCEPKVTQLFDFSNAPTQGSVGDVMLADCKALFRNGPFVVQHNACVCDNGTFSSNSICVFFLGYQFPNTVTDHVCPSRANGDNGMCVCDNGFKNDGSNRVCIRVTDTVYPYNTSTNVAIPEIAINTCQVLFGNAAQASAIGGHCQCASSSVAFWKDNRCYFLVDTRQSLVTPPQTCPPGSVSDDRICICPYGFKASGDKRGCEQKEVYSNNLQSIDLSTSTILPCNASYNDSDCEALHGAGGVCRHNTCYCDRSRSFVRNNRCELFSKYVFPGAHERSLWTCTSDEDCGPDPNKNGIECNFIDGYEANYKVCKCKRDYFLNPADSTCVKDRCPVQCPENSECNGYRCICKVGYYTHSSGQCLRIETPLTLHERCNVTLWNTARPIDNDLNCSSNCERAQCVVGYRDNGAKCVRNSFDDPCFHNANLCSQWSPYARCYRDDNRCACLPGFYRSEGEIICAGMVDGPCVRHVDCGDLGQCLNRRCRCKAGLRKEQVSDSFGRRITRCINGGDQIRFSPVLFLCFVIVRVLFA